MAGIDPRGAVVVVTGASSGIGRATALEFARRGAHVVAVARRLNEIEAVARECESLGAEALALAADTTDGAALDAVARTAVERFGRLDAWVNNASVGMFAKFEDAPADAYRRVIETNLFGYINGARAALPHFRAARRGVLINVASILGKIAAPYLSAYSLAKFAVVGFGESLRQELLLDGASGIQVSTILPASIDTPFFQHAANLTGRGVKPINPIIDAQKVAAAIVSCAQRPRREVLVGSAGVALTALRRISPRLYEQVYARQVELDHFEQGREVAPTLGNVFAPVAEGTSIDGGWKERQPVGRVNAGAVGAAVLGAAVLGTALLRSRGTAGRGRRD